MTPPGNSRCGCGVGRMTRGWSPQERGSITARPQRRKRLDSRTAKGAKSGAPNETGHESDRHVGNGMVPVRGGGGDAAHHHEDEATGDLSRQLAILSMEINFMYLAEATQV